MFVSNETKSVLSKDPKDLSFSSEFDMYKIQQEKFAQSGQTLGGDHGLTYFPFLLAYRRLSNILSNGKAIDISTANSFVTNWSFQTLTYIFVAFNPGLK